MSRVYNFSAGPSMLPEEVLKKAQTEMLEYGTSGMSVMEMSHRSKDYQDIIDSAEALVRELMHVPDNYKVLLVADYSISGVNSNYSQNLLLHFFLISVCLYDM